MALAAIGTNCGTFKTNGVADADADGPDGLDRIIRCRMVSLAAEVQPEVESVLADPHTGRSTAEGEAMQASFTKGMLPMTRFSISGLDGLFEQVPTTGIEVLHGPLGQHQPGFPALNRTLLQTPAGPYCLVKQYGPAAR